jgi:hypothetical protein
VDFVSSLSRALLARIFSPIFYNISAFYFYNFIYSLLITFESFITLSINSFLYTNSFYKILFIVSSLLFFSRTYYINCYLQFNYYFKFSMHMFYIISLDCFKYPVDSLTWLWNIYKYSFIFYSS